MAAKRTKRENGWTPEVAKKLVSEHFQRKREYDENSALLVKQVATAFHLPVQRIQAATALYKLGAMQLQHYLSAVDSWSSSAPDMAVPPTEVPEWNVINWAKALTRAKTKKAREHAEKMLALSVETLGSA